MFKLSPNIAIHVKDYEKAVEFYTQVLSFEFKEKRPFDGGEECVMDKDGVRFYFEKSEERFAGATFFEFETEDIHAAVEKLKEAGCNVYRELSAFSKMVKDPYGMMFHVYQKGKL